MAGYYYFVYAEPWVSENKDFFFIDPITYLWFIIYYAVFDIP